MRSWGRSTPLGAEPPDLALTAGVGRLGAIAGPIVIGALLAGRPRYPWGFYVFAGVAALAVVTVLLVGHPRGVVDEEIAAHTTIAR